MIVMTNNTESVYSAENDLFAIILHFVFNLSHVYLVLLTSAIWARFKNQKPKFSERPIRKARIPREPIRTKKETSKLRKARENARD